MKGKYVIVLASLFLFFGYAAFAQNKYERAYRIRKVQFPEKALNYISEKLEGVRRLKFYKEKDSSKISFEAKFKKERLWYSVEFNKEGGLEDIEISIQPVDIPQDVFAKINTYLRNSFLKNRIRSILQQYPITGEEPAETTIKNAFQNLMLPSINYKLVVSAKKENRYEQYEILFDSKGNFKTIRKSLPPNYDHVLF
jgi:hypothetical protein